MVELLDPNRVLTLTAADFEVVNPNTYAAPVFRSRRDAEITTAIYRRQPIAVDLRPEREGESAKKVWPVRYVTQFHMTNDSMHFLRRDELKTKGWYPIEGGRWKKGEAVALPLYVGKMIWLFDHR